VVTISEAQTGRIDEGCLRAVLNRRRYSRCPGHKANAAFGGEGPGICKDAGTGDNGYCILISPEITGPNCSLNYDLPAILIR